MNHQHLASPEQGIALFDLDGTLLPWDCQLLFRHFVLRREPWRGIFLPVFLVVLPLASVLGAGRMKRVFLCFLWGMGMERRTELSRQFAAHVIQSIYPEMLEIVKHSRAEGKCLIMSSASPEFYVREIGEMLGFDLTFGTVVDGAGFFPKLLNHKGAVKVSRLRKELPPTWFTDDGRLHRCHGYTDSRADLPMLAICDSATVVNPSPKLEEIAAKSGWRVLRPARPWENRLDFAWRVLALLAGIGADPAGITERPGKNPA